MTKPPTATVYASDTQKFSEATLYTVVCGASNDSDVRWSYIEGAVRNGSIASQIVACDRDGSHRRFITVSP